MGDACNGGASSALGKMMTDVYFAFGWQPMTWLYVFIAVTTLDAALTLFGLSRGITEANYMMRWCMSVVSAPVALFVTKSTHVATLYAALPFLALWMPVYVGVYALVCVWNLRAIVLRR